jgi:hypothetical protein
VHHLLNNFERIGRIHHQPAVANKHLGLAPERRDVLRPFWQTSAARLFY